MANETYLGDGVYARLEGDMIWLRTQRDNGDHQIALEQEVFEALVQYRNDKLKHWRTLG